VAAAIVLAVGGVLAAVVLVSDDPKKLLTDATTAAAVPPYYGMVATIAVGLLAAVVGACLMAAGALRSAGHPGVRFAFGTALALGAFVADDALLLHEAVGPALGVPEVVILAVHGAAWSAWAWVFRTRLLSAPVLPMLAVVASVLSVLVDQATEEALVLEDAAKLVGLVALSWFVVRSTYRDLTGQASRSSTSLAM
jgi:hypothetical protein